MASTTQSPAASVRNDSFGKALAAILLAAMAIVPLVYTRNGADVFRVGKLTVFRADGILILAVVAIALLWNIPGVRDWRPRRVDVLLAAAAVLWTVVTMLTSTNRANSLIAVLTIILAMAIFLAATRAAQVIGPMWLYVLFGSAIVIVVVMFLQLRDVWIVIEAPIAAGMNALDRFRLAEGSLFGNRNYAGTFLVLPAILAFVFATRSRGRIRVLHCATFAILAIGLLGARTMTALGATAVGIFTVLVMLSWKRALVGSLIVIALVGAYFAFYTPVQTRGRHFVEAIRTGQFGELSPGRVTAYRTAWRMFLDNPVFGVGPGRFGGEFLTYVIAAHEPPPSVNFGETHNDHLQVLAETGAIGYAILVAAMIILAKISFRARGDDETTNFAADAALPVVTSFAVVTLAQFPMQTEATMVTYATIAGLLRGWAARGD